jgi:hypothetical protein
MSGHTELRRVLATVHFPCRKGYLISRAAYEGASRDTLDRLRALDDIVFDSPERVLRELGGSQ